MRYNNVGDLENLFSGHQITLLSPDFSHSHYQDSRILYRPPQCYQINAMMRETIAYFLSVKGEISNRRVGFMVFIENQPTAAVLDFSNPNPQVLGRLRDSCHNMSIDALLNNDNIRRLFRSLYGDIKALLINVDPAQEVGKKLYSLFLTMIQFAFDKVSLNLFALRPPALPVYYEILIEVILTSQLQPKETKKMILDKLEQGDYPELELSQKHAEVITKAIEKKKNKAKKIIVESLADSDSNQNPEIFGKNVLVKILYRSTMIPFGQDVSTTYFLEPIDNLLKTSSFYNALIGQLSLISSYFAYGVILLLTASQDYALENKQYLFTHLTKAVTFKGVSFFFGVYLTYFAGVYNILRSFMLSLSIQIIIGYNDSRLLNQNSILSFIPPHQLAKVLALPFCLLEALLTQQPLLTAGIYLSGFLADILLTSRVKPDSLGSKKGLLNFNLFSLSAQQVGRFLAIFLVNALTHYAVSVLMYRRIMMLRDFEHMQYQGEITNLGVAFQDPVPTLQSWFLGKEEVQVSYYNHSGSFFSNKACMLSQNHLDCHKEEVIMSNKFQLE